LTASRTARTIQRAAIPSAGRCWPGGILCDNPVSDELAEAGGPGGLIDDRAPVAAVR
jgi:hypothetical protein